MKFINVMSVAVALCATVSLGALQIPQCYQYADTQIVGKFSLDEPISDLDSVKTLSLLCDSFGIDECDHGMASTFPSVMCNEQCPWVSQCDISKFDAFKSALPSGKKLVFTGAPIVLGARSKNTFSCESKPIGDVGFDAYDLIINLPCTPGENTMDFWNVTNVSCSLSLRPGKYPVSGYTELTQNITLNAIAAGSVVSVSILAVLVSMILAILA